MDTRELAWTLNSPWRTAFLAHPSPPVPESLAIQTAVLTFHERELALCHRQGKADPDPQMSRPDMVEAQTNQFSYHPSPHPEL